MPAYDAAYFNPPAPVALVSVRSPSTGAQVGDVPMILDSNADVSLLPRAALSELIDTTATYVSYELEAFDGTRSQAAVADLELRFLGKSFRGQFLLMEGNHGILGRNILNSLSLLFDGPRLTWNEQR